jgi:hypothetical protein
VLRKVCEGSSPRGQEPDVNTGSEESPPQPLGVGYRDRPPKGCASMPRNEFPVRDRHVEEPILFIGIHRSVTPSHSPDSTRVPWRSVGTAVASLVAPVGIGMLHRVLGEVIVVIEIMVALTIIMTALFGSQDLSERAFRLLRWLGNRPEPPAPDAAHGDEVAPLHLLLCTVFSHLGVSRPRAIDVAMTCL